jgi:hypothetical protein
MAVSFFGLAKRKDSFAGWINIMGLAFDFHDGIVVNLFCYSFFFVKRKNNLTFTSYHWAQIGIFGKLGSIYFKGKFFLF